MVNASELRIGNWIEAVAKMGNYPMQMTEHNFRPLVNNPDCANPIPLTAEVLRDCGFAKNHRPETFDYSDGKHLIYSGSKKEFYFIPFCTIDTDLHIEVKYLHNLQNLIFALTKTELTYKPK